MTRSIVGALVGLLVLSFAVGASAGIPDPDNSTVVLTDTSAPGMTTCSAGDGSVYQYIKVTAKNSLANPIQGIPYSSFFFTVTGYDVTFTHVDAETDANGEIRFTCIGDEGIVQVAPNYLGIDVQIYTVALTNGAQLECNSYDMNEDGTVGLADFGMFSAIYGTNATEGDYNWDGTVGLADFGMFSAHYGH